MIKMDPLALRVKNRYLCSKTAETIGDPRVFLPQFETIIRNLEIPVGKIENAKKVIERTTEAMMAPRDPAAPRTRSMEEAYPGFSEATNQAYDAYFKVSNGRAKLIDVGHKLFLSILQSYTLPPAIRKKVEMASRAYMKQSKPRLKEHGNARYLEMFALYEKFMAATRGHLETARKAVQNGKTHQEEGIGATKMKVGDFTLINTGGFPEKVMQEVADVVQKAQALAKSSGFGAVCYGDIQVTNTVGRSAKVLAFYLIESDQLFIRANVKSDVDTIQTVLHELGHRHEHKILGPSKKPNVGQLYYLLNGQERSRTIGDDLSKRKPAAGEELHSKGKTYKVLTTVYERGTYKVRMTVEGKPGVTATVPLEAYLELKGEKARDFDTNPKFKGFVSDYAKKSPSENFAEMFSYYCMGRLPVLQSAPFEELAFGASKTAAGRLTLRVASRWILEG